MAYARVPFVSDLLEFLAGWDLSDGVIDTVDTVEVDRHLPVVAEQRLTGVLLAAMRAGEVEVDRPRPSSRRMSGRWPGYGCSTPPCSSRWRSFSMPTSLLAS